MSKTLNILIADDEPLIRLDLKEMLEEHGHKVVGEAKDGEEAVELAKACQPDLMILDIKMPRLDGLEALEQIGSQVPTIMLTAYSQPDLVEKAVELGVFAYLVKPVKDNDLLPAIDVAMARAKEFSMLKQEAASLQETLEVRKVVEKAKGYLMDTYQLSEAEAFRRIQKVSMDSRRPMKDVAEAILLTRQIKE